MGRPTIFESCFSVVPVGFEARRRRELWEEDFRAKKFSPPRPSGREGLMFPPEQSSKDVVDLTHPFGGRKWYFAFY